MGKYLSRVSTLIVAVFLFYISIVPLHNASAINDIDGNAPSWTTPIDYIALGDSLAAGTDPQGQIGLGYPDYLAEKIKGTGFLKSYSKDFSHSGYTAAKVLADLQENVTSTIDGTPVKLHDTIAEAELITISAGANDVLPLIDIDAATGTASYDLEALNAAIRQVGITYIEIIAEIHEINPNVQVYVMGYYNPYPHMPAELQPLLTRLLDGLNLSLRMATDNPKVEFVATKEFIGADFVAYLPNPTNIHLSAAGYKVVAEQFWTHMQTTYGWIPADSIVADLVDMSLVNLTWTPASGEVTSYEIYNGDELIATVAGDVHKYNLNNINEETNYTFSVIAVDDAGRKSIYNPTVEVSTGEPLPLFTDISTHWAKHEIELAAMAKLFSGYPDGTFRPDHQLTRVQAASVLVRALNLKTYELAPFMDIADYASETQADIHAAYQYGLVNGLNNRFKPSDKVTRAQLALMMERAYFLKTGVKYTATTEAPYTDVGKYDEETVNAISMLYELGIATGFEGKFMPGNSTTRAHAVKMLINLLGS